MHTIFVLKFEIECARILKATPVGNGAAHVARTIARSSGSVEVKSFACRSGQFGLRSSLPQLAAQDLARRRSRDDCHKVNFAGLLVVSETVGDEVAHFLLQRIRGRKAVAEDDKGAGNFSSGEVGFGDDSTVADGGMFEEDGFDFGRGDGESLVLDHLLFAVEDVVEAFGIAADDVTREIPAIAKNGGGRLR